MDDYLIEKKIEYLIDLKVGKLRNELAESQKKVLAMTSELDTLRNMVHRLNSGAAPQRSVSSAPVSVQASAPVQASTQAHTPTKTQAEGNSAYGPGQRTGQWTPEQVSVDKMFYFGNKRS